MASLEAVALDEPHRVERAAVGVVAQAVDRDDPGVLQPAGDLGLQQEPRAAVGSSACCVVDLLEGDLAVQLVVEGDEDLARAAPGVGPEDAERGSRPRSVEATTEPAGRCGSPSVGGREPTARERGWPGRRGRGPRQGSRGPSRRCSARRGSRRVAAVLPDVLVDHGSSRARRPGREAPLDQDSARAAGLLSRAQALIAAIRASRAMKSICKARMPNSRLRSPTQWLHPVVALRAGRARWPGAHRRIVPL